MNADNEHLKRLRAIFDKKVVELIKEDNRFDLPYLEAMFVILHDNPELCECFLDSPFPSMRLMAMIVTDPDNEDIDKEFGCESLANQSEFTLSTSTKRDMCFVQFVKNNCDIIEDVVKKHKDISEFYNHPNPEVRMAIVNEFFFSYDVNRAVDDIKAMIDDNCLIQETDSKEYRDLICTTAIEKILTKMFKQQSSVEEDYKYIDKIKKINPQAYQSRLYYLYFVKELTDDMSIVEEIVKDYEKAYH